MAIQIEYNSIDMAEAGSRSIAFARSFETPPIVVVSPHLDDNSNISASAIIKSITKDGFEFRSNYGHARYKVNWIAVGAATVPPYSD